MLKKLTRPKAAWLLPLAAGLVLLALIDLRAPSSAPSQLLIKPLLAFYRAGPGRLSLHRCPSQPACSRYLEQAVARHGLIMGLFIGLDRLIHEHGRLKEGPWVVVDGRIKLLDPLEANTWWWSREKGPRP